MAGNFFTISLDVALCIANKTKSLPVLLSYLVLCKFQQDRLNVTTAGANAIKDTLGCTRYRAEDYYRKIASLRWGNEDHHRVIVPTEEWNRLTGEKLPTYVNGKFKTAVLPSPGITTAYLSNNLVDGIGRGKVSPPVKKLNALGKSNNGIATVLLLLQMNAFNSIADFGGVDIEQIHCEWEEAGSVAGMDIELGLYREVSGVHYHTTTENEDYGWKFSDGLVKYVANGDRAVTENALRNLFELNLVHKVAMVFDMSGDEPEAMYPLWVYDSYVREKATENGTGQGGLARECLNALCRVFPDADDLRKDIFDYVTQGGVPTGLFVYAVATKQAEVLSVIRLKHLPDIEDNEEGLKREEAKTKTFKRFLDGLLLEKV